MALTRAAAHELGPHGITVNCLCPGYVVRYGDPGAHSRPEVATWSALSPLGRLGEPSDVARAATFLASSDADYLTDRKSTRLNSSHANISYAVFCLKKKKKQ